MLVKNPAKGMILRKAEKSQVAAIANVEAKRFVEAYRASTKYTIFEFALETGMRPKKYLAL